MAKKVGTPKKVDVVIETNRAEIEYHKDGINQELNYDGKKIDVNIKKDATGTKVTVAAANKKLGNFLTKIITFVTKKFKK
jgi:hypothetical protein